MSACAIVLAAGAGRRAGGPKAVRPVGGRRLIDRAVATARVGGCEEVIAVLRTGVDVADARVVVNDDPDRGLSSSLRLGLAAAVATDCDRAVVMLVDQPGITGPTVARLRTATGPVGYLWFAVYDGVRSHPVRIDRSLWPDVARDSRGDGGAKIFARNHPELVREVDCTGWADPIDLDTDSELASWTDARPPIETN